MVKLVLETQCWLQMGAGPDEMEEGPLGGCGPHWGVGCRRWAWRLGWGWWAGRGCERGDAEGRKAIGPLLGALDDMSIGHLHRTVYMEKSVEKLWI